MKTLLYGAAVALATLGASANAATYDIILTGDPTSGSGGGDSYRFQLAGDPITIADGDTINATLEFTSAFTVPSALNQFIFLEFYREDGTDPIDPKSSSSENLINGETYTGGCSNCLSNLFNNGGQALTFSGGTFSTTFALSAPFEITNFQFGYQVDGIAGAAPEPTTWALFIIGFGLIGSNLRRRRVQPSVKVA